MDDQHAEQVMTVARHLDSETVRRCGPAVHISFRGFDETEAEVGHAQVRVTAAGVSLSELEHTQCSSGVAWAGALASWLHQLDGIGKRHVASLPDGVRWWN